MRLVEEWLAAVGQQLGPASGQLPAADVVTNNPPLYGDALPLPAVSQHQ